MLPFTDYTYSFQIDPHTTKYSKEDRPYTQEDGSNTKEGRPYSKETSYTQTCVADTKGSGSQSYWNTQRKDTFEDRDTQKGRTYTQEDGDTKEGRTNTKEDGYTSSEAWDTRQWRTWDDGQPNAARNTQKGWTHSQEDTDTSQARDTNADTDTQKGWTYTQEDGNSDEDGDTKKVRANS